VHDLDDGSAGSGSRASEASRAVRARDTAALFGSLNTAAGSEHDEIRHQIVLLNAGVALAVARRYHRRGIDAEDVDQTACLALVQAVRSFDPERGHDFMSFAVPTIVGGVKKHFRDHGWTIRVPRRVQEVQGLIDREGLPEADENRYGAPTVGRLAERLHLSTAEIEAALRARGCFSPASLDQEGILPWVRGLGNEDGRVTDEQDAVELRSMLSPLIEQLAPRDRWLLRLRFDEDRTQQSIADELRVTQAQVSRLLSRVIGELRSSLGAFDQRAG
jgi:RNA polymerase sigma-B factor